MKRTNTIAALAAAATLTFGLAACDDGPSRQEVAAQEKAVEDAEKRAQEAEEAAAKAEADAQAAQEAAEKAESEAEAQASADAAAEAEEAAQPSPEPVETESYEMTAEDEAVIVEMALDMTWAETSASDQVDICMGWGIDEEWALDMVSDGYETEVLSMGEVREIMRDFFTEKCG